MESAAADGVLLASEASEASEHLLEVCPCRLYHPLPLDAANAQLLPRALCRLISSLPLSASR